MAWHPSGRTSRLGIALRPPRRSHKGIRLRISLAKHFGRLLGKQSVEINFLDAVGLAALFDNGKDFDVPVEIFRNRAPVCCQLALGVNSVRSGMHDEMICRRNLLEAAKCPAQQRGEIATLGANTRLLEQIL